MERGGTVYLSIPERVDIRKRGVGREIERKKERKRKREGEKREREREKERVR